MGWTSGSANRGRRHVLLPVTMCVLLGACATGGVARNADRSVADVSADASADSAQVVVNNQSGERVTVYISQGSEAWRLGDIEPYSRRTLSLTSVERELVDRSAFLIARRPSGPPFRSESFAVTPDGGMPTWTIESYTPFSYVSFR
jgi:hypothetical protein